MKTRLKKLMCALSAAMCLMGTSIHAFAIDFNVTPPADRYSYAVKKNDSEQFFYVTGTSFSKTATLYCYSQQVGNNSIKSETGSIYPSKVSDKQPYKKSYASYTKTYEMYTYASASNFNVRGRYTP